MQGVLEGSSTEPSTADASHDVTNDHLVPGCVCATAAHEILTDTVWFVKILERYEWHVHKYQTHFWGFV